MVRMVTVSTNLKVLLPAQSQGFMFRPGAALDYLKY